MHMDRKHISDAFNRLLYLSYARGRYVLQEKATHAKLILNRLELQESRILIGSRLSYCS
jgi:hypothetical protein